MTTNVYDGLKGVLATDSRWSCRRGRYLIYIDNTNFHKIEVFENTAFMFAGNGRLIQQRKDWIKSSPTDESGVPDVNGICISGIDTLTKQVKFSEGMSINMSSAIFAGSGAPYAYGCWMQNKNAQKAVDSAKMIDPATGGDVKFLDFSRKIDNLAVENLFLPSNIDQVNIALNSEGIIMDISNQTRIDSPFKVSDLSAAASASPDLKQLKEDLSSNPLSAEAPCDAMYSEWTAEATSRLSSFLGEVFNWKK